MSDTSDRRGFFDRAGGGPKRRTAEVVDSSIGPLYRDDSAIEHAFLGSGQNKPFQEILANIQDKYNIPPEFRSRAARDRVITYSPQRRDLSQRLNQVLDRNFPEISACYEMDPARVMSETRNPYLSPMPGNEIGTRATARAGQNQLLELEGDESGPIARTFKSLTSRMANPPMSGSARPEDIPQEVLDDTAKSAFEGLLNMLKGRFLGR